LLTVVVMILYGRWYVRTYVVLQKRGCIAVVERRLYPPDHIVWSSHSAYCVVKSLANRRDPCDQRDQTVVSYNCYNVYIRKGPSLQGNCAFTTAMYDIADRLLFRK
jgi:hypothetical protein